MQSYENEPLQYEIIRSRRRTLSIEVHPDGSVLVRAPYFVTNRQIAGFVSERTDWVEQTKEKLAERPEKPELSAEELAELRKQAKAYIPGKVAAYAQAMGVSPTALRFTSARTRWSSCSAKNSLSFSVRLMQYPKEAVDYVIVHELAHIREHNHSPRFWAIVAAYMPDYKARKKLLK